MKPVRIFSALLACVVAGCNLEEKPDATDTVSPRQADTLDPEELGIAKYVFESKVPADKVMVLRQSEERDGKKSGVIRETIAYANGGNARLVVLMYDSSDFPFSDGKEQKIRIKDPAGDHHFFKESCSRRLISPTRVELELSDEANSKITCIYECSIEAYDKIKQRLQKLPAIRPGVTWRYQNTIPEK